MDECAQMLLRNTRFTLDRNKKRQKWTMSESPGP